MTLQHIYWFFNGEKRKQWHCNNCQPAITGSKNCLGSSNFNDLSAIAASGVPIIN